jgi:hypothetical protein
LPGKFEAICCSREADVEQDGCRSWRRRPAARKILQAPDFQAIFDDELCHGGRTRVLDPAIKSASEQSLI